MCFTKHLQKTTAQDDGKTSSRDDVETRVGKTSTQVPRTQDTEEGESADGQVEEKRLKDGETHAVEDNRGEGRNGARAGAGDDRQDADSPKLVVPKSLPELVGFELFILGPGIVAADTLLDHLALFVGETFGELGSIGEQPP